MNGKTLIGNKLIWLILLIVIGTLGYYFWHKQHPVSGTASYRLVKLVRGDVTQTVSANGTLNPVVLVNVGTQVSGTVKHLLVDFNAKVQKGQVLMELDSSLFQAQLRQSEANVRSASASLELAQANEARMRGLFAKEYVSRLEYEQSSQALKVATAQLDLARAQRLKDQTNLNYSVIRSPVSGVVVAREVDIGQTVAASFQTPTLFKIAQDLGKMQIDSSFAEADIGNIRVGQAVNFTVDAFAGRTFTGVVKQLRLNPTTLQNVVTYNVVVNVDNPELILLPGMTAYVNIAVATRKNVLLVPNEALRFRPKDAGKKNGRGKQGERDGYLRTVYILENGQPKPVKMRLGITDNKVTEVVSAPLMEGREVIAEDTRDVDKPSSSQGSNVRVRMF